MKKQTILIATTLLFALLLCGAASAATIQDSIDAAAPGDTIELESGTYTENIVINKNLTIKPAQEATVTIQASDFEHPVIDVLNEGSGSTIQGLNISSGGLGLGIFLREADNVQITLNTITNHGLGIYAVNSNNIKIYKNTITDSKIFGITIGGDNNVISGNTITNNGYSGILFSGNGNIISDNKINNNGYQATQLNQQAGISSSDSGTELSPNIISGNTINGNQGNGIDVDDFSYNQITKNTINDNGCNGISIRTGNGNIISGNTINNNGYQGDINEGNGIFFIFWSGREQSPNIISGNTIRKNRESGIALTYYSNYNQIVKNTISDNGYDGIILFQGYGNTIEKNLITNNGYTSYGDWMSSGIFLYYSGSEQSPNIVSGNTITNNEARGIDFDGGNYNQITKNTIKDNKLDGIRIGGSTILTSTYNLITQNTITNNQQHGILIDWYSDGNLVTGNTITKNFQDGIYIRSNDTKIIDNVISKNGYQGAAPVEQSGIVLNNALNAEISGNTITKNKYAGIYFTGSSTAGVHLNNISNNDEYGLENTGSGAVNAENNWWGTKNNPTTGTKPQVINTGTGSVDADPWKKSP